MLWKPTEPDAPEGQGEHKPSQTERPIFRVQAFNLGLPKVSIDCTAEALEFEEAAEEAERAAERERDEAHQPVEPAKDL